MKEKASCAPQDPWTQLPGVATDLGAGGGAVWMIGQGDGDSDFGVFLWDEENRAWIEDPAGVTGFAAGWSGRLPQAARLAGARAPRASDLSAPAGAAAAGPPGERPELGPRSSIAVDERGRPWIADERQRVFRRRELSWERLPGSARDLDCGGDTVWAVGTGPTALGGSSLYCWDESRRDWLRDPVAYGVRVAVDDEGIPWHVNALDELYRGIAAAVRSLPGRGRDLGAGGGAVWRVGTEPGEGGGRVWKWDEASAAWLPDDRGFAARITVDAAGRPWRAQANGYIYRQG